MNPPERFTYPFCYVPHPLVVEAADRLINKIDSTDQLKCLFSEGKMMGALIARDPSNGEILSLYAFSGLAMGRSHVDGFVPPIYDTQGLKPAESADDSRRIQEELFNRYIVHNYRGEAKSVKEIFAARGIVPPGGTGDCAAPKLLEHAYRSGYRPLAMGEFWYGASPSSEVREQGRFYPSCTGKCGPLLTFMMEGLDVDPNPLDEGFRLDSEPCILYEDDTIIVAEKPAGMLSVPGRTRAISLLEWLRSRYGEVHSCHRLDMDTSGVMVFARTLEAKVNLELQFAGRDVHKTYRARLSAGNTPFRHARKGTVALPLSSDYYDRPRQIVDYSNGKKAVTGYDVLEILPNGEIEVRFTPLTGRTHQLRVHSAHKDGLGHPIKGDRLYGSSDGGRLFLHAESISFLHPADGVRKTFESGLKY